MSKKQGGLASASGASIRPKNRSEGTSPKICLRLGDLAAIKIEELIKSGLKIERRKT